MTAIVKDHSRTSSPLALAGLALPGLGHLIPWAGTFYYDLRLSLTRRMVGQRRDAEARQRIMAAEDARRAWFKRHGDHGDFIIGVGLMSHLFVLVWTLVLGLPRLGHVLMPGTTFVLAFTVQDLLDTIGLGPAMVATGLHTTVGQLDIHGMSSVLFILAMIGVLWGIAWYRAFPRQLSEEQLNSNGQVFIRTMKKNTNGMVGLVGVLLMVSIAFITPWVSPFDPTDVDVIALPLASPGTHTHPMTGELVYTPLGTDAVGRDLWSRVLYGARISLSIGFVVILIAGSIGTFLGAAAGFFGGWVDRAITWFIDLMISVPRLVLLLAILGIFSGQDLSGSGKIFLIVTVLGLTGWMGVSRIVRGQVLSLSRQDFIQAARALGLSPLRIMLRHLVPNAVAPIIVYASLAVGSTILVEASLSFLGLGISQPTPTWGSIVSDGKGVLLNSPWVATFPGLLIVWAVLSFNLLGDGLRDALDPKFRGK